MSYVVDQHHSADFSRASERQAPPIRQHELDASVIGPLSRLIIVAEVTAHAEMQNQSATVIESNDQILAAPHCVDETASAQASGKRTGAGISNDIGSGDHYSVDALAESSAPKIEKSRFYFRKLGHRTWERRHP